MHKIVLSLAGFIALIGSEVAAKNPRLGEGTFVNCQQTHRFSDGSTSQAVCPGNQIWNQIHCSGRYCDNLHLKCCDIDLYGNNQAIRDLKNCEWEAWSSDGHGWKSRDRPVNQFTVGMRCKGRYCDDKAVLVCPYQNIEMEPVKSSEYRVSDEQGWGGCGKTSAVRGYAYSGRYADNNHGECHKVIDYSPCPRGNAGVGCAVCHNNVIQGNEECDDETIACLDCFKAKCGDKTIQRGTAMGQTFKEECDDGYTNNQVNKDCTHQCLHNVCGDTFLHDSKEECEKGPSCTDTCKLKPHNVRSIPVAYDTISVSWDVQDDQRHEIEAFRLQVLFSDSHHPANIPRDKLIAGSNARTHLIDGIPGGRSFRVSVQAVLVGQRKLLEEKWSPAQVLTPCHCEGDDDAPGDIQVKFNLKDMSICPQWRDRSVCDSKYHVSSKAKQYQDTIVQFGNVNAQSEACGTHVANTEVCEDLRIKGYAPGTLVSYCVQQQLGISIEDIAGNTERQCTEFAVPWVATIQIDASLEDDSRNIPLVGYKAEIYIGDTLYEKHDVTSHNGVGVFNVQLNNSLSEYERVSVRLFKKTGGVDHDLKCVNDQGALIACEKLEFQVKHLSFQVFRAKDLSVRSIKGQLTWQGTEKYTGGNPCAVANEIVCVRNVENNDDEVDCEETDATGNFNFALPIFRTFEIFVDSKFGHEFVTIADKQQLKAEINVTENVDKMDFLNIDTSQLDINFYGGECESPLLGATFVMSSDSCEFMASKSKIEIEPGAKKARIRVPSLAMDVTYLEDARQGVDQNFQTDINLFFAGQSGRRPANLTLGDIDIEFKYYSVVDVELMRVDGQPQSKCESVGKSILHHNVGYNFTFDLSQEYPSGVCKRLPNTTVVKILDKIAERPYCRKSRPFENGCSPVIEYEATSTTAMIEIVAGEPNLFEPHTKELHVETRTPNRKPDTTIIDKIVLGERANEFNKVVVGFPQWVPILILRRPPGDSSFAEFSRVSGIKNTLSMFSEKTYDLVQSVRSKLGQIPGVGSPPVTVNSFVLQKKELNGASIGGSATSFETQTCAGVTCFTSVATSGVAGFSVGYDVDFKATKYNEVQTDDVTKTTFKTSDSARSNSVGSDLFVLPNLLMVFRETDVLEIFFNETTNQCKLQQRKTVTWAPEPKGGSEAISAVSEYDVHKTIRRIKVRLKELKKVNELDFDKQLYEELEEAAKGWENMLKYNEDLKEAAYKNPTKLDLSGTGSKAVGDDLSEQMEDSNKIRFQGGGQTITQTVTSRATQASVFALRFVKATGSRIKKSLLDWKKMLVEIGDLAFSLITGNFDLTDDAIATTIVLNMVEELREDVTTSFTLKDKNIGDEYLVEVYTDPVYGTPVFKTIGGRSKCMHENGTVAREKFDVVFAPGQTQEVRNIRVGETGFMKIEIHNNNDDSFLPLLVSVDPDSNPHGLKVTLNGHHMTNEDGIQLDVYPGKMRLTLAIEQGSAFDYKDIEILVRSSCEPWKIIESLTFDAYFLEKCAGFDWSGNLLNDRSFAVTSREQFSGVPINEVPITIRRLPTEKPFDEQRRLKKIEFQYRRVGNTVWETPIISEQDNGINGGRFHGNAFFDKEKNISLEDSFGFSKMYWDTSVVQGGDYEIRVIAGCTKDTGIEHLDNTYSDIIVGTIDRLPPAQHNRPTPQDGKFVLGESFSISFDEKIDCTKPYSYKAILDIPGIDDSKEFNSQLYEKGYHELTSYCHDNTIEISLTAIQKYEKLMGQEASMKICNVYDLSENGIPKCIKWDFKFMPVDLDNVVAVSEVVVNEDLVKTFNNRRRALTDDDDDEDTEKINPEEFADDSADFLNYQDDYANYTYDNYDDPEQNVGECMNSPDLEKELAQEIANTAGTTSNFVKILCIQIIHKNLEYPSSDKRHDQIRTSVSFEIYSDENKSSMSLLNKFSRQLIKDNLREDSIIHYVSPHPLLDHATSDSLTMRVKSGTVKVQDLTPEKNVNDISTDSANLNECPGPFPETFPRCARDIEYLIDHWKDPTYLQYGMDGTRCSIQYYLFYYENACPNPNGKDIAILNIDETTSTTTTTTTTTITTAFMTTVTSTTTTAAAAPKTIAPLHSQEPMTYHVFDKKIESKNNNVETDNNNANSQINSQQVSHQSLTSNVEVETDSNADSDSGSDSSSTKDSLGYRITHVDSKTAFIVIGVTVGVCLLMIASVMLISVRKYKENVRDKEKFDRLLLETQDLLS